MPGSFTTFFTGPHSWLAMNQQNATDPIADAIEAVSKRFEAPAFRSSPTTRSLSGVRGMEATHSSECVNIPSHEAYKYDCNGRDIFSRRSEKRRVGEEWR